MDPTTLVATLQAAVPGAQFEAAPSVDVHATVYAPGDRVAEVARALRDHPDLGFSLLEITAADYRPREPRFEVVYTLVALGRRERLRLKVRVGDEAAHLATVSDVWPAANWLEREVWDLFGIVFDGHPDLRRLLTPEDWEGHPLRKDYPVQIRMRPQAGEPLQVTEEEFRANLEKDRRVRHE